jgi:hypothetical protein
MTDCPARNSAGRLCFVFEERSSQAGQLSHVLACQTNIDAEDLRSGRFGVKTDGPDLERSKRHNIASQNCVIDANS